MKPERESPQEKKSREYTDRVTPGNRRHAAARKDEKTSLRRQTRSKSTELLSGIKAHVSLQDAEILAGELTAAHLRRSVNRKRPVKSAAVPLSQIIEWHLQRREESFGRKRKGSRPNAKYDKLAREAVETLNSIPRENFADIARRAGRLCSPEHRHKYENEALLSDPLDRALYFLRRVSGYSEGENQALCRNKELDASLGVWIAKANRVLAKDRLAEQEKLKQKKVVKEKIRSVSKRWAADTHKSPVLSDWASNVYAGSNLISHTVARAVPSAQRGLTSVFGMGTGDPSRYCRRQSEALSRPEP